MDRWKSITATEKIRDAGARKGREVAKHSLCLQSCVAPQGRKVGWLMRRVRSHLGRWKMNDCTPLWREAHLGVKSVKNWRVRTTFGRCDVEKAVGARSTFGSENAQNTSASEHFYKLRCRKSARRCGAKPILKSKVRKTPTFRTTFGSWDVENVHAVVARGTCRSEHVQNTPCSDHFWKLRSRKSAGRCGAKHIWKSKRTKHHMRGPLFDDSIAIWCRKSAHRCGAKHISKSKALKAAGLKSILRCQLTNCS